MAKTKSLPSIKDHLQETWQRLQSGLLPAFVIAMLAFVVALVVVGIFGIAIVALVAGATDGVELFQPGMDGWAALAAIPVATYGLGLLAFLVFMLVMVVVGSVSQAGQIMAFQFVDKSLPVKEILSRSLKLVPAMVGLSFIGVFLILGSFWLFFLPAVLIGMLLTFSIYEVVLDKVSPIKAIHNSVAMVTSHFGYVISRLVVFVAIYLFIFVVLPGMADEFSMITLILSFFWSWFSFSYLISMYQAIKQVGYNKKQKTWWLWVVAILGWLVLMVGLVALKKFVGSEMARELEQEISNQLEAELGADESNLYLDYDSDQLEQLDLNYPAYGVDN